MTSREFCYWLQGYFELRGENAGSIGSHQAEVIKKHLALVFKHEIDPSMGPPAVQAVLNDIHGGHGIEDLSGPGGQDGLIRC